MRSRRVLIAAVAGVALLNGPHAVAGDGPAVRSSRFFRVNLARHQVEAPLPRVPASLHVDLISITTDQPQYWPHEKVYLKAMVPAAPGSAFTARLQARNASATTLKGRLDAHGVAVLTLLDGAAHATALGEYRVDVATADGLHKGSSTFAVVEGSLGAVSLAWPFERATSAELLDGMKGGWFLGNASGAGKRWGNGLSFKNEIRVANQPFSGEVEVHSRCMLPGCNGVHAGPSQTLHVDHGHILGTMAVGGHSGPFQIEVVTPKGTVRHQFEGSSHVERDMVVVSGGMGWLHRAGMAPYENTTQVPGRQIFVESRPQGNDTFELANVVASNGAVMLRARRNLRGVKVVLWQPGASGKFAPEEVKLSRNGLQAGEAVRLAVNQPYTFVTAAGFEGERFHEGWGVLFAPTQMSVTLEAPDNGLPGQTITVDLQVNDAQGQPLRAGGVLEAFDVRVASRNPLHELGSALGESVRNTSRVVSQWRDDTGMAVVEPDEREEEALDAAPMPKPARLMVAQKMLVQGGRGASAPPPPPRSPLPAQSAATASTVATQALEEAPREVIRQDEKKVVACVAVQTDKAGHARVAVTLPPQVGRVSLRFAAVHGLDHQEASAQVDLKRDAYVELQLPHTFVPGARLVVPVTVANQTGRSLVLTARGPGFSGSKMAVGPGVQELMLPWAPVTSGDVEVLLSTDAGKVLDARRVAVRSAAVQPVVFSRLVMDDGSPIAIGKDETAVVYAGPGALMRGVVMNMVTTMESWFGHAEALGARAATSTTLLAAFHAHLLDDEGLRQSLLATLEKSTRDLETVFWDGQAQLFRPYPGVAASTQWTAWVSASLHRALNAAARANGADPLVQEAVARMTRMTVAADASLRKRGVRLEESGGYDAQGRMVIPVELDGKVVYRVPVDDAVTKFAVQRLLPRLGTGSGSGELNTSMLMDAFRFLRAFERVGMLQYLAETALGLWDSGNHPAAIRLYNTVARGMILAQEPGMVQGPALLGGVYSTPRAMGAFLTLMLAMAGQADGSGQVTVEGGSSAQTVALGQTIAGPARLNVPSGAVVRADTATAVDAMALGENREMRAAVDVRSARVGQELHLSVTLPAALDPLEYVALVAVPTTTTIKQTQDILSDQRGVLIYGTQQQGGTQMQVVAVAFRGKRTVKLWLEGAAVGTSTGYAVVRHVEDLSQVWRVPLPAVRVQQPAL